MKLRSILLSLGASVLIMSCGNNITEKSKKAVIDIFEAKGYSLVEDPSGVADEIADYVRENSLIIEKGKFMDIIAPNDTIFGEVYTEDLTVGEDKINMQIIELTQHTGRAKTLKERAEDIKKGDLTGAVSSKSVVDITPVGIIGTPSGEGTLVGEVSDTNQQVSAEDSDVVDLNQTGTASKSISAKLKNILEVLRNTFTNRE